MILVAIWFVSAFGACGQASVELEWDPPVSHVPAGYRIYYGPATRHYTNSVDAGAITKARICCLVPGVTYFFASTAYRSDGEESVPSPEFVYRVPDPNALALTSIGDLVLLPRASGTVGFGVRLGTTSLDDLRIKVESSNLALIPESSVLVSGSGTNFTASIQPLANVLGNATITLTAHDLADPSRVASESFQVSVTALETASTLNAIPNRSIAEDAALQTIGLSGIGSPITTVGGALRITASSSNPKLIPHPTVRYSSPATTGSLTFAPMPNTAGLATITVSLKDVASGLTLVTRTFNVSVWEVNDAPTLDALPDLEIQQGMGRQSVALSGISSGAGNEAQPLVITALSSNPTLIPHPTVTYSSPSSSGVLSLLPAVNQSGVALITVKVDDGQSFNNSITRSFRVSVKALDVAPTLEAIANRAVAEDSGPQTISLTGIASANGNRGMTLTAVSSNPGLIPPPQIDYQSPADSGVLRLAPIPNASGSAKITVTLNDGRGAPNSTFMRSFTVAVWEVNDAPTIASLPDLKVSSTEGAQRVNLSGITSGAENEAQPLTVTAVSSDPALIPHPVVTYQSPSAAGLLTFTPTPGAVGTVTLTVRVSDGQGFNGLTAAPFRVTLDSPIRQPSVNPVADQWVEEDSGPQSVPFQVLLPSGRGPGFAVSASCSQSSLIGDLSITEPAADGWGILHYTPLPDANGTAVITLRLDDGKGTTQSVTTRDVPVTVNGVNDPPTLDPISDRTVSLDTQSYAVSLTGIGPGASNERQSLTITAVSSDRSCVPDPLVAYAGPATTASLTLFPTHRRIGTSTITVTVNDGQSTNNLLTRSFNVKVDPPVGAPTIDPIQSVTLPEDAGVQSILLTGITSPFGPASPTLSLSVESSDPHLIPAPTLDYVPGSTTGRLWFKSAPDAFGRGSLAVTVQDSLDFSRTATAVLSVVILEVNDPPTLDPIADLTLDEDALPQTIALAGITAGVSEKAAKLTVSARSSDPAVVPDPAIVYESPDSTGSLVLSPAPDAFGKARIRVVVSDGGDSNSVVTRWFDVTVKSFNDPPTLDPVENVTIAEDSGTSIINLTGIGPGAINENDHVRVVATSSDPELISNPLVSYFEGDRSATLALTPNPNRFGRAVIEVGVSEDSEAGSRTVQRFTVTVLPVNDPPMMTAVPDIAMYADSGPMLIDLTGISAGAANETDVLSLTATSSDSGLMPDPEVRYVSPGPSGSLMLAPVPSAVGTVQMTLTLSDGQVDRSSWRQNFTIHLLPPPTNSVWVEAESGVWEEPTIVGTHTNASGGSFLLCPLASGGPVSLVLSIPRTASYALWARVQPPDLVTQLCTVSVDGLPEVSCTTTNPSLNAPLQWVRIGTAEAGDPQRFFWTAGEHHLSLRPRAENLILDALYATTDLNALPPFENDLDPTHPSDSLPPYPWVSADVGAPSAPGSARFRDGIFHIRGSGNIGGAADQFHYVFQTLAEDGVITAKLSSARGSGASERVGLMIRQSLAPESPYVFLGTSGREELLLQRRESFGAQTASNLWQLSAPPEVWVQLSRERDTIYAFAQVDGVAWHLIAIIEAPSPGELYFGMAVASEDPQSPILPSFSGVTVSP